MLPLKKSISTARISAATSRRKGFRAFLTKNSRKVHKVRKGNFSNLCALRVLCVRLVAATVQMICYNHEIHEPHEPDFANRKAAKRQWKLASYEVAGFGW